MNSVRQFARDHTHYYMLFIALAWVLALSLVRASNWGMGTRVDAARQDAVPVGHSLDV